MPQKHKITAEEKVKLVRAYLSGEITQRHAGKVAMVSPTTIQVWIKRYEAEGIEAFYTSSTNRVYSPETK
ncbi:helix-turn-helix domain-containing protein, partial [Anaerovibrio sp.]|uniref:helix-turn-helix domain-containing protein n=1 Tax=Anaerovibrio sp. TaxID=1872532 RepID=UPI0025C5120F